MEPSEVIWSHLEPPAAILSHLQPSGAIWSHLKPSEAVWGHLKPHLRSSGAIWSHSASPAFPFKGERGRGRAQRGPKTTHSGRARIWTLQAALPAFLVPAFYQEALRTYLSLRFALALALAPDLDFAVAHVSCLFLSSLLRFCSSICFLSHCAFRSIADQVYWYCPQPAPNIFIQYLFVF